MTYTRDKEGYMLKDGVRDMRFKPLQVSIPVKQAEPEQEALWEADTDDEEEEEETYEVIEKPKPKQKKPRAPKQPKEKKEKKAIPAPIPIQPVIEEQSKIELPPPFPTETFMMKSRGAQSERKTTIEDMSRLMRQRTMKLKF